MHTHTLTLHMKHTIANCYAVNAHRCLAQRSVEAACLEVHQNCAEAPAGQQLQQQLPLSAAAVAAGSIVVVAATAAAAAAEHLEMSPPADFAGGLPAASACHDSGSAVAVDSEHAHEKLPMHVARL